MRIPTPKMSPSKRYLPLGSPYRCITILSSIKPSLKRQSPGASKSKRSRTPQHQKCSTSSSTRWVSSRRNTSKVWVIRLKWWLVLIMRSGQVISHCWWTMQWMGSLTRWCLLARVTLTELLLSLMTLTRRYSMGCLHLRKLTISRLLKKRARHPLQLWSSSL